MLSPNSTFYARPLGVTPAASLPQSPSAPLETSRQLVGDDHQDAPYFRSLEEAGIRLNGHKYQPYVTAKVPCLHSPEPGAAKRPYWPPEPVISWKSAAFMQAVSCS